MTWFNRKEAILQLSGFYDCNYTTIRIASFKYNFNIFYSVKNDTFYSENQYLSFEEVLEIASQDAQKEILFNLDLFKERNSELYKAKRINN